MTVAKLNLTVNGEQRDVLIDLVKHPKHLAFARSAMEPDASMPVLKEVEWLHEEYGPCARRKAARCFQLHRTKRGTDKDVADVLKTGVVIVGYVYDRGETRTYFRFVPYDVLTPLYPEEGNPVPHMVVMALKQGTYDVSMKWFPAADWTFINKGDR